MIDERQKIGTSSIIINTMTKRGGEALANEDWDTAIRCYDSILDYDGNNVDALMGKLKATKHVINLEDSQTKLDDNKIYIKLFQLVDAETKEYLKSVSDNVNKKISIKEKRTKTKKITLSVVLVVVIATVTTVALTYQNYIYPFISYQKACSMLENGKYSEARKKFIDLKGYKDSKSMVIVCNYAKYYDEGMKFYNSKNYKSAIKKFEMANLYKDTKEKLIECNYLYACELSEDKKYSDALKYFNNSKGYKDTEEKIKLCKKRGEEVSYKQACEYLNNNKYYKAITEFESLNDYKDSKDKIKEAKYGYVLEKKKQGSDDFEKSGSYAYQYLNELKNAGYKDSARIYNSLYSWNFKCWVNDDSEGTTSKTTILPNEGVYVHVKSLGAPLDDKMNLHFVFYNYDSDTKTYKINLEDDQEIFSFGSALSGMEHGFYINDEYSATKYYVEIYNSDTKKLIDKVYFNY